MSVDVSTYYDTVPANFWIKHLGRDFVLYSGLLDAVHRKGLQSVEVTPVQLPSTDNNNTAIMLAKVSLKDGTSFEEIGDANDKSVGKMIAPHIIRMAATRAKARAMRDAINIGVTAKEELGDDEEQELASARKPVARQETQPQAPTLVAATALTETTRALIIKGQTKLQELGDHVDNPNTVPVQFNSELSGRAYIQEIKKRVLEIQADLAQVKTVPTVATMTRADTGEILPVVDASAPPTADQIERLGLARTAIEERNLTAQAKCSLSPEDYSTAVDMEAAIRDLTVLITSSRAKSRKIATK